MKKLAKLKREYYNGEKNMSENMPNEPIDIRDENFDEYIKKYVTIVVDCWAPWCGPCRMVGPVIDELAKEMQGEIVFGKLNVDENQVTASKYGINLSILMSCIKFFFSNLNIFFLEITLNKLP